MLRVREGNINKVEARQRTVTTATSAPPTPPNRRKAERAWPHKPSRLPTVAAAGWRGGCRAMIMRTRGMMCEMQRSTLPIKRVIISIARALPMT